MFDDLSGVHIKADFDHKLIAWGETVIIRQNINNETPVATERRAIKEGNIFRFSQSLDLKNGDILELQEDGSRWKIISFENYRIGNIPISFNVTTNPIINSPREITIL